MLTDYRLRWRTCTLLLLPVETAPPSRCLVFSCPQDPEGYRWAHQLAWGMWTSKSRLGPARIHPLWLPILSMGSNSARTSLKSNRIGRAGKRHSSRGEGSLGKVLFCTFGIQMCEYRSLKYPAIGGLYFHKHHHLCSVLSGMAAHLNFVAWLEEMTCPATPC